MIWKEIKDPERSAITEAETDVGMHYEISPNQRHSFVESKGYSLYRLHEDFKIPWGYVGELEDGSTKVICGPAIACAQGLPPEAVRETIEELKIIAEKDLKNFKGNLN